VRTLELGALIRKPRCGEVGLLRHFTPEHPHRCLDVWGGGETVDIRGSVDHHRVRLHLTPSNSCEIMRWNQLRDLLERQE
jgi:hypothetical protein